MIDFSLAADEFGALCSTVSNGRITARATASNVPDALADLSGAVDNAEAKGVGECFWPRESGAYRWLLRRDQDRARVVLLWSIGTMTGWENLFWTECGWTSLETSIRRAIKAFEREQITAP